jgi:hypothetical protein
MTIFDWHELQQSITAMQRFVLWLAERGENQASAVTLKAVVRAQRIKPTKEQSAQQ